MKTKNEQQLVAIKDQGEKQLDAIKNYGAKKESLNGLEFLDEKQQEREKLSIELRKMIMEIEKEKEKGNLLCVHTNGEVHDFNKFTLLEQFYHNIISGKVTIKQAKNESDKTNKKISDLEKYNPTNKDRKGERLKVLKKQTKSLKSTLEVVSFYYICKLYT